MDKVMIAAEGRMVLQEDGSPWPSEGKVPEDTLFNRRRIADGDLIAMPPADGDPAPKLIAEGDQATKPKDAKSKGVDA